jgi:two-component system, chemotaxis family, sensor kinase CheA
MLSLIMTTERSMAAGLERIDRELREARDAAERLRLVPAASVFNALERTARDAAHSTGKQVVFAATGGEVRIDGEVLDTVQSALIQLVRNAVAHGIESTAQRVAAGKPPTGKITLEVSRRGYRAWFRCRDDGGGVDLEAVRRVAQGKGTSNADLQRMDASALLALLLKGGLTTTSVVTELSGRGVGLDVVREAMQRLNGEVLAHTAVGGGTTIELRVPLSLAALDVLIIEADGQVAALPLDAVQRTLRITQSDISRTPKGDAILFEGRQIPFLPLRFGIMKRNARNQSAFDMPSVTAVVITSGKTTLAIAVERLRGMDTIVLRPLPTLAPATPIVLGVHLDNEGNPRMVLDPDHLVTLQSADSNKQSDATQRPMLKPILIIDDSLTTRMLESSILESAGFAVEMAACAEEGLEMARRNDYALFLVDVEMPGMDGFTFVEHTRADAVLRDTPCILVTSRNAPEDRRRGNSAGASAYIVKGEFDQVEFLERVNELVQQ